MPTRFKLHKVADLESEIPGFTRVDPDLKSHAAETAMELVPDPFPVAEVSFKAFVPKHILRESCHATILP